MVMPRLLYEWLQFSYIPLGLVWEKEMEWNGMEKNKKNNFRIFFTSLVWEF